MEAIENTKCILPADDRKPEPRERIGTAHDLQCPECGNTGYMASGCFMCPCCGYSPCG